MNKIAPIRALKDNYIWMISQPESNEVWVVDPGNAQPVISMLDENQLKLAGILITHHHLDHSGGISDLLHHTGNIPVYGSYQSPIKLLTHRVKEGDEIICGSLCLRAIEIPGHTLDHTAYFGNHVLFSGDTLFSAGCGKIFEGTAPQMFSSLQKLSALPDDTKIYCGHEYTLANLHFAEEVEPSNSFIKEKINFLKNMPRTLPSLMADERKMNPFLRYDQPEVINSVEKYAAKKMNNSVEVFSCLREWKNNFTLTV